MSNFKNIQYHLNYITPYPTFFKQDIPKKEKILKPIPKISEKKKKRLKEEWSESAIFMEIWGEREHKCEECGKLIQNPKPHHFDHVKWKWMNKDKRLDKSNIQILCFGCHFEKTTWLSYKWINLD